MPRNRGAAKALIASLSLLSLTFIAVAYAAQAPTKEAAPPANGYARSAACQSCHESQYASWRRTLHLQMTRPIAEARVEGAFGDKEPVRLEAYGRSYAMEQRDGRYFIAVAHGERP